MKNLIKKTVKALTVGLTLSLSVVGITAAAGLMTPVNSGGPQLDIRSHKVQVVIENGYAITQVDQIFSNPSGQDLEATYHFPVPDKAAVSEFTVWIDGQPVIGEVLEKNEAATVYQEEKNAGRDAGITQKNKHYNFEIKVTPVRANQDTRIRLVYMQPVDLDTGVGRYVYPLEDGGTDDQALSFWSSDTVVHEDFSFNVKLRSGYPVAGVRVPAHPQAIIVQDNEKEWSISMDQFGNYGVQGMQNGDSENQTPSMPQGTGNTAAVNAASLDKDVVVYWKMVSGLPGSVDLVTHKEPGKDKGTFMLTLTPGDDLGEITEGRDWAFVLDMSGSMQGKYTTLVDGVQRALGNLRTGDRFRIIRFNNQAQELTRNWIDVTSENVSHWSNVLAGTQPNGGTNLYAGTEMGLKALDRDRTSAIVLVTDGEANVGTTEKKQFLKLMEHYDVRLFTAVMGNGANRPLLEAMTEISNGFAVSVSNSDDIVGKLMEFTSKATHQALHDVDLKIKGIKTAELTPSVTTTLYRGEQLVVLGHYWGSGEARVSLSGKISGQETNYDTQFDFPEASTDNPEIERLWAYAKTQDLQKMIDYLGDDGELKSAIVNVAVSNGLVTDHTSMVVMRDEQFNLRGIERKNRDRRQREISAANNRSAAPVVSRQVDQANPAFSKPRASHSSGRSSSGGGAFFFELLLLIPFVGTALLRLFKQQ